MISDPKKIGVLGLGNWGTALGNHLAKKGYEVLGWSNVQSDIDGINKDHRNPTYLKDVELHLNFRASTALEEALQADLVVLVFPSAVLSKVVPNLVGMPNDVILVSAIKGFEQSTLLTPLQYTSQHLKNPLCVISGPSFAVEVVRGRPAGVVAASSNEEVATCVAKTFTSPSLKVYTSTDTIGVELGGAVKNVIAVAAGVSDGLELGESARAGLITRGLAEMMRLAAAMGAKSQTLAGLSGLGDLTMTSTSPLSRNHTVGYLLGQGKTLQEILASLGSVAEGVHSTPLVLELARRHNVEMPITDQVDKLIRGELSPRQVLERLILRPMKSEF